MTTFEQRRNRNVVQFCQWAVFDLFHETSTDPRWAGVLDAIQGLLDGFDARGSGSVETLDGVDVRRFRLHRVTAELIAHRGNQLHGR